MKCDWNDCFTCPYPDCILSDNSKILKSPKPVKEKHGKRTEEEKQAIYQKWVNEHKEYLKEYNKAWTEAHKEWRSEYMREYYSQNKEIIKKCRQMRKIMKSKCFECNKEFQPATTVLKYKGKYFCSDSCLGEYLLDQAEGITEIEYDTPENIRICALEEKGEY